MSESVETCYLSVEELAGTDRFVGYDDPCGRLKTSRESSKVWQQNPYLRSPQQPARIFGVIGRRVIGGINPFPLHVIADGTCYEASAGDSLFVDPEYRRTGYALELVDRLNTVSADQISLNAGLSIMAQKLFRMLGVCVFPLWRFALVRRSRLLLGPRLPAWGRGVLCMLADVAFWGHRVGLKALLAVKTRGWRIEAVPQDDREAIEGFCRLVARDGHRFRQDIDLAWVKWIQTTDFHSVTEGRKTLYVVKKRGKLVGYFLTRYTEDGLRGVILEWQVDDAFKKSTSWMLLRAAFLLLKGGAEATVVSVPPDETAGIRVLSRLLPKMPDQVVAVGTGPDSPLLAHPGFEKAENWRLRHGMGDASFY